jgi:hypothetical protein
MRWPHCPVLIMLVSVGRNEMSVLISDVNYKEYMILQHNAIFQEKMDSVNNTKNLKDDIDAPIRNVVGMLALLGCEPMWSCCGFDYDGQPMHKTHEYGDTFVALRSNHITKALIDALKEDKIVFDVTYDTDRWETWETNGIVYLRSDFDYVHEKTNYPWSKYNCIHYPELAVFRIRELEKFLLRLKDYFMKSITLSDTNDIYKKRDYNWQYPVLEPWIIKREDYNETK